MRLYSIIIPAYNRPDELDDLLSSLCKQTYVHFEVIVVEDGSEIPAKEIVGRYQGRLDLHYYVISNSGPGMARNHGARQVRGEYLLILDSDVVLPSIQLPLQPACLILFNKPFRCKHAYTIIFSISRLKYHSRHRPFYIGGIIIIIHFPFRNFACMPV